MGVGPQPIQPTRAYDPEVGSEGLIAQLITELCRLPRSPFLNHPGPDEIRKRKVRRFIVLTDLIGSGRRARDYLEAAWQVRSVRSWSSLRLLRFEVLAYATTDHGRRRVDHDNLEAQDAARSVLAGGMLGISPRWPRPPGASAYDDQGVRSLGVKNFRPGREPAAPGVKREAEEDWGK